MFNLRTTCHGMLTKKSWLFDPSLTTTFLCILETNNLPFTAAIPQSAAIKEKHRLTRKDSPDILENVVIDMEE